MYQFPKVSLAMTAYNNSSGIKMLGEIFGATGDESTGKRIKLCRKWFTVFTSQLRLIKKSFPPSSICNAHI
jgi:hypothetical protein